MEKIKVGQIWRNKEKNYTIKVIAKDKKGVWKVSAHGKGKTTHGMTENSFHFYELVEENCQEKSISKECDNMNAMNTVRHIINNNISNNHFFSIKELSELVLEKATIDPETDVIQVTTAVVSAGVREGFIKKHTDKKKNSINKKIFQKIQDIQMKTEKLITPDIKIGEKQFIKTFNNLDIDEKFDSFSFYNQLVDDTGCGKLDGHMKTIVKARMYNFIADCVKKGYIYREKKRFSILTKIKNIESGFSTSNNEEIPIEETPLQGTLIEETPKPGENIMDQTLKPETLPIKDDSLDKIINMGMNNFNKNEKEIKQKLSVLKQKFRDSQMGELIETGAIYFNILFEKDRLHGYIISRLNLEIDEVKEDNTRLLNKITQRNQTIKAITKIVRLLSKENKKFDKDIEFQMEENEKLKLKNTNLQNKVVQLEQKMKDLVPEETDAWKSFKLGDFMDK